MKLQKPKRFPFLGFFDLAAAIGQEKPPDLHLPVSAMTDGGRRKSASTACRLSDPKYRYGVATVLGYEDAGLPLSVRPSG